MTGPGLSVHVGAVDSRTQRDNDPIIVVVDTHYSAIGSKKIPGFFTNAAEAEKESAFLAEPLAEVTEAVAGVEGALRGDDRNATEETLSPALTIEKTLSTELMKELRVRGSALRKRLTKDCESAFKTYGFLTDRPDRRELNFQADEGAPHVLWDLMYEGDTRGEVKWESFWGFRVPIAHWVFAGRTPRLRPRSGLFSGIDETLPFAAREIEGVANRLEAGGQRASAADYFRQLVHGSLVAAGRSASDADAWIDERNGTWLQEFLTDMEDAKADARQWKHDRILDMIEGTAGFDLLHFACDSKPTSGLASQAEIRMTVGGEELTLDVAAIMSNLHIEITDVNEPGPLVFLNACRSVTERQPFQPPPFATSWINDRGALAVISAVCPLPDFFAHAFALKFYDFLLGRADETFAGIPVRGWLAGALLATRRYFMQEHNNPLGLAYILYAMPGAHVVSPAAGSGP